MSITKIINKKDQEALISARKHRLVVAAHKGHTTRKKNECDTALAEAAFVSKKLETALATHKQELEDTVAYERSRYDNVVRGHRAAHTRLRNERDRIATAVTTNLQAFVDQLKAAGVQIKK